MTETHATPHAATSAEAPVFPPGRYGRRREPARRSRMVVVLIAVAMAAAGLVLSVRLYQQYGSVDFAPRVLGYSDITDDGITVEFEVRKAAESTAYCRVRARGDLGDEVGLAEVEVGPGERPRVTYRLATSRRPVTVEVPRCSARPVG